MPSAPRSKILSISPVRQDHTMLRRIASGLPWRITAVSNCREAKRYLGRTPFSLIVCESNLPDGTWADVLQHIAAFGSAPLLIVTSRLADNCLWAEVLNRGGYDVLAKPFREEEVRHVLAAVKHAAPHHSAQPVIASGYPELILCNSD